MTTSPDVVAPATVRDIRTPDGRMLRTYEAGDYDGLLVLVHHGTPCSGVLAPWWAQDAAEKGIRLVGYDRPGYAGSDRHPGRSVADVAADAAAIADALGAERFATWGVSGGGPHALACAALLPERVVAAATLASVAPYDADGLDWFAGMGQDNLDEFGAALQGEIPLREYLAPASAGLVAAPPGALADEMRSLLPPVDVAALTGPVGEFSQEWLVGGQRGGYEGWLDDDLAFARDWGFDLADIRVPVMLLQGRHDLMVPFAHGEWLAGRIPTAQPRLTDDDGHMTLIADLAPVHAWLVQQAS
ncbi:MAG: alpha/beta fold hydrolase [Motilibacteraceae bacterium]